MRVGSRVVLLEPAQVQTCNVVPRPVPGGGGPLAGGPVLDQRRPRPARWFPARSRAGIRLSLKARTCKGRGGVAPAPRGGAARFPLARFGGCCPGSVRGAISSGILRPIWNAFSSKNMLKKHFYDRKSPNQGTYMGTVIAPPPGQCGTNPKTSERQQAGHKNRGPGAQPRPSFSPFLGRNGDPRRAGGATGRCAPRAASELPTQRVRTPALYSFHKIYCKLYYPKENPTP